YGDRFASWPLLTTFPKHAAPRRFLKTNRRVRQSRLANCAARVAMTGGPRVRSAPSDLHNCPAPSKARSADRAQRLLPVTCPNRVNEFDVFGKSLGGPKSLERTATKPNEQSARLRGLTRLGTESLWTPRWRRQSRANSSLKWDAACGKN